MVGKTEVSIYCVIWTGNVLYSMYQFHQMSFKLSDDLYEDLEPGWNWVGSQRDSADFEWKTWAPILLNWLKYVAVFLCLNNFIRKNYDHYLPLLNTAISFVWLSNLLGFPLSVLIFLQPLLLKWFAHKFSIVAVWGIALMSMLTLHSSHHWIFYLKLYLFQENSTREYLFSVLLAWTHARCISFIVDVSSSSELKKNAFESFYQYCFYLPLLPSGPLLLYRDFEASVIYHPQYAVLCTSLQNCDY